MAAISSEQQAREIFKPVLEADDALKLSTQNIHLDDRPDVQLYVIEDPWGDPTLALIIPSLVTEAEELSSAMQRVILPPKFSGIYHKASQSLEIFWTAHKVRDKHQDVVTRSFDIWWRGQKRNCHFGPSSEETLIIAKNAVPTASASHTEHRNLMSFHTHVNDLDSSQRGEPVSFWLDCADIAHCDLEDYLRTINFYMTYYDRETPRILIHETGSSGATSKRPRYVDEGFPAELVADEIDISVASFWLGAFETRDLAMRYLLHYRLIEFLALSHLKGEQHKQLVDILRRPHLISSTESAAAEVAGLFTGQARETDRIKNFVEETVRTEKVWAVLDMNRKAFSSTSEFDGGFAIKPVFNENASLESWSRSGPISLVDRLRAIRNCLAHGQDDGTKGVIHTTKNNRVVLMPWVNLIETFAAEAMLYARRTYVAGVSK